MGGYVKDRRIDSHAFANNNDHQDRRRCCFQTARRGRLWDHWDLGIVVVAVSGGQKGGHGLFPLWHVRYASSFHRSYL